MWARLTDVEEWVPGPARLRGAECALGGSLVSAQGPRAAPATQPAPAAAAAPAKDPLGRETPRGTVLGFMSAGRARDARAPLYLNTTLRVKRPTNWPTSSSPFSTADCRLV